MAKPRLGLIVAVAGAAAIACKDSSGPDVYHLPTAILAQAIDTVALGDTAKLTFWIVDNTFDTLRRITAVARTSDSTIVGVATDSTFAGLKIGTATVTITALDTLGVSIPGVEADILFEVVPQTAASMHVGSTTDSVAVGSVITVVDTVFDKNGSVSTGHTITWLSGNKAAATVVAGKVTGVAVGTARITAATDNGVSATTTIRVVPKPGSAAPPDSGQ